MARTRQRTLSHCIGRELKSLLDGVGVEPRKVSGDLVDRHAFGDHRHNCRNRDSRAGDTREGGRPGVAG